MAVTDETLRLAEQLRAGIDRVLDAQTRDLVRAWATAWDEVAGDLNTALLGLATARDDGRVTRAMAMRSQRLQRSLAVIAAQLDTLAAEAGVRIVGDLDGVVDQAGSAQADIIASQLPRSDRDIVASWSQVSPEAITAIVERSTEQITSLSKPLAPEAYDAVRRELIRGVAAGSNPRDTARRMVQRAEGRFNGGLTRALVISRTETLDAHREAARVGQTTGANADILTGWLWSAKLDLRTCPACFGMHGRTFPVATPGPLGHQQCRCGRIPKTKSWADLGIDLDEPDDLTPDAEAAFAALTPEQQLQILGPRRFEAWLAGDYPMSTWSTRRSTDGWRDSYVVSAAPPARGGGRGVPSTGGSGGSGDNGAARGSEPPERPGRYDVGDSLTTHLVGDETRDVVQRAIDAIGSVHGVDQAMPNLPVVEFTEAPNNRGMQRLGSYSFEAVAQDRQGPADRYSRPVVMSVNLLDENKVATLIHELAHFLDHKGLGDDPERFASVVDQALNGWRAAIRNSAAVQTLQEMAIFDQTRGQWSIFEDDQGRQLVWNPNQAFVVYALDPRELFARSYAQWVALRSGDDQLLDGVMAGLVIPQPPEGTPWTLAADSRSPGHPSQWVAEDFEPIAAAFDELFASLGVLRTERP